MPHPRIESHELDNGLRVLLHRDATLPLVAVNLWYHVGSKHERPGRTGFAHLFEHMLFQGSKNVAANDHFRLVQQVGGVANGSTWYDRTNYYETLPSNRLELGLWLEADRMGYLLPAMTSEKLENQRSVVMNERRQRVDSQPYGRAYERLHELLYPAEHPYHWPVIGYMEDIAAATLEDVEEFFRTYYTPSNAVLTLAGELESERAVELVDRYFGPIAAGPSPPEPPVRGFPDLSGAGQRREVLEDNVQLPRVYLAYCGPAFGDEAWPAGSLVASLLSEGKSSRLFRDLVYERQLAQNVAAYLLPTEECSTFIVVATAAAGQEPERLEEALDEHLRILGRETVTPEELVRVKNHALTGFYGDLQTLDQRADLLSHFATFGRAPEEIWEEPERYSRVSAEDLRRFVETYCHSGDGARVVVVPGREATTATTERSA